MVGEGCVSCAWWVVQGVAKWIGRFFSRRVWKGWRGGVVGGGPSSLARVSRRWPWGRAGGGSGGGPGGGSVPGVGVGSHAASRSCRGYRQAGTAWQCWDHLDALLCSYRLAAWSLQAESPGWRSVAWSTWEQHVSHLM